MMKQLTFSLPVLDGKKPQAFDLKLDTRADMSHIVALSGGKDSTAMAIKLRQLYPEIDFEYICTPTGNELPSMIDHWLELGQRLGKRIKPIGSGYSLGTLIKKWDALPNWRMRWCTRVLKIEPFQQYLMTVMPATCYVGIRADELDRDGVDYESEGDIIRKFPLQSWGWGIREVVDFLEDEGIIIPPRTDCAVCFYQTLGEWFTLWKDHPKKYKEGEDWEKMTGHTFRSEQRDSWPARLQLLREEFENGRTPKSRTLNKRSAMCSFCSR